MKSWRRSFYLDGWLILPRLLSKATSFVASEGIFRQDSPPSIQDGNYGAARVVELAYTTDLKSVSARIEGSSPSSGTIY